jgi:hypothetical protein
MHIYIYIHFLRYNQLQGYCLPMNVILLYIFKAFVYFVNLTTPQGRAQGTSPSRCLPRTISPVYCLSALYKTMLHYNLVNVCLSLS